jgi:hypothetical protein
MALTEAKNSTETVKNPKPEIREELSSQTDTRVSNTCNAEQCALPENPPRSICVALGKLQPRRACCIENIFIINCE